jgi:hypothetical protein
MKKLNIFIAIVLVALVAGAWVYFNWRSHLVKTKLPELVYLKSDSLYTIQYSKVLIDEVAGEIKINNLLLLPDTSQKKAEKLPKLLVQMYIPVLHLTGLRSDRAVLNEEVIARNLKLEQPVVTLFRNTGNNVSPEAAPVTTHELYKVILRNLTRIKVDSITISNASWNMLNWSSRDTLLTAGPVNVTLRHLHLSDSTSTDTSRVFFSEQVVLSVDALRIGNRKDKYCYTLQGIDLDSKERLLTVNDVAFIPFLDEAAFARASRWQTDRFDAAFQQLQFNNVSVREVLDGNLVAEELLIHKGRLKIYRDKSKPLQKESKVGNYPHQQLMKLPFDLALQRVQVNNSYVEYKEKNPGSGASGAIRFHQASLTMEHVTNRQQELERSGAVHVAFQAKFLDAVPLKVKLTLYPADKQGRFTATGTMGATDAAVFNQLIRPLALASIESGTMNGFAFNVNGNNYQARGTVKLLYSDLKLHLLKRDSAEAYKKKELASFLANVSIKNQNPGKNKELRVASVEYDRDIYRSFFNLLWKSLFVGIRQTVGIE